jgi:hypothetical protein
MISALLKVFVKAKFARSVSVVELENRGSVLN